MVSDAVLDKLLDAFETDGSLRDILVTETNSNDWRNLLVGLRQSHFRVSCSVPSLQWLEASAEDLLTYVKSTGPAVLEINVTSDIIANLHFCCEHEIELDLDPREVTTRQNITAIIAFLRWLSKTLAKRVLLTPEGSPEAPMLSIDHQQGDLSYSGDRPLHSQLAPRAS